MKGLPTSLDGTRHFPAFIDEQYYLFCIGDSKHHWLLAEDDRSYKLFGEYRGCSIEGDPPSHDRAPEATLLVDTTNGTHRIKFTTRSMKNACEGSVVEAVSLAWWVRGQLDNLK